MRNLTHEWKSFSDDIKIFGILKWYITETNSATSVNFLDMTLSIEDGIIILNTFQKLIGLHPYILSVLRRLFGIIKDAIYGLMVRYFNQNTYKKDFTHDVGLLY